MLVADDDPVMRTLMVEALTRAGFDVVTASDGQGVIDAASVGRFDAIVLDLLMPSTNGLQATHALRAEPNGETLPIIIVSGLDDPGSQAQAFSLGADDFITKPIVPSELVARVRRSLRPGTGVGSGERASAALCPAPWPPPAVSVDEVAQCPWPAPVSRTHPPRPRWFQRFLGLGRSARGRT